MFIFIGEKKKSKFDSYLDPKCLLFFEKIFPHDQLYKIDLSQKEFRFFALNTLPHSL